MAKDITGPGLHLEVRDWAKLGYRPQPTDLFVRTLDGRSTTTSCLADVQRFRDMDAPDPGWGLSAEQVSQVHTGLSDIIEVDTSCGTG